MTTFRLLQAAVLMLAVSGAAAAQTVPPSPAMPPPANGVFTDAPVPSVAPERVAPADRAGSGAPTSSSGDTPFSAGPTNNQGSQISPGLRDTPQNGGPTTPNLSK